MARVYIGTQGWGVLQDTAGNVQAGVSATVKNRDGTNATHYSARTGGSSSTGSITSSATGTLERWIEPGEYTVTVGATTVDVETSGPAVPQYARPTTDDTTNLTAYIAANDEINLRPGTYTISSLSLNGLSNKRVSGAGVGATNLLVTGTTGRGIDMEAASFCEFSDMLIRQDAQRTSGQLFYLTHGSGSCQRNKFRRLRIGSPYKAWYLLNCTTTDIEDVQFIDYQTSWPVDSLIHLAGQTTSTTIKNLRGGTAATVSVAAVLIDGGTVDTVLGSDWDLLNLGGTGYKQLYITNGRLIKMSNISLESGTAADALTVGGGHLIDFSNVHLLGQVGAVINGGTRVRVQGGDISTCARNAVTLGGGTHHEITDLSCVDLSGSGTGTYPGIYVAGGVTDFTVANNLVGPNVLAAQQVSYGIRVETGASDRYIITGNRCRNFVTAGVSDGGTGVNKSVTGNVSIA
jgi:hypothetical protein